MLEAQKIKRFLVTLLKGSPIIILCLIAGLVIAKYTIKYSSPVYRSIAKIKLDDHKYGMSSNNLYDDFDLFTSENKIQTEAEILQSPLLIEKTLENLDLCYKIWRKGSVKNALLYKENPFSVTIDSSFNFYNEKITISISNNSIIKIFDENGDKAITNGKIGEPIYIDNGYFQIDLNSDVLSKKTLDINGDYLFLVPSKERYISEIQANLDVKPVDKEIAVIRVVYTSEDPEFAADFANELCKAYVEDYIDTKSRSAQKTLQFIDERMHSINQNLSQSEDNLESYKIQNDVVNTLQETETGLREISKLKLQLINMETEELATRELQIYIEKGDYYQNTAVNFGFGDLVLTELVKKLKLYTDEKKDLQLLYTDEDERVINCQAKIDDVEKYIKEAVKRNLLNIETKRREIKSALNLLEKQFEDIPTREKEMRALEREFLNNEAIYNFLFQKKLEAQIASSALISFHRIIQPAIISNEPVSPNKVLITFVSGFLSLIIGILIVFGRKVIGGKIIGKADVEKLTATPIISAISQDSDNSNFEQYANLAGSIISKTEEKKRAILITSSIRNEGKTFLAKQLSEVFNQMGYKVAVLHLNPSEHGIFPNTFKTILNSLSFQINTEGITHFGYDDNCASSSIILAHKNFAHLIEKIKEEFDILIFDTPAAVISPNASNLLRYVDQGLYLIRSKYSKAQYISNIDLLQEETGFENMSIVLNGVHHTTNHSGNFNGSNLNYLPKPKGFKNTIKHYFKYYIK